MDNLFKIETVNNVCLILSTSYISPLDDLFELENSLRKLNFKGEIVFDLLLCNGISSNRFLKGYFNGKYIDVSKIIVIKDVSWSIKVISRKFYKNNSILDNSILPKSHRYIIKNGLI